MDRNKIRQKTTKENTEISNGLKQLGHTGTEKKKTIPQIRNEKPAEKNNRCGSQITPEQHGNQRLNINIKQRAEHFKHETNPAKKMVACPATTDQLQSIDAWNISFLEHRACKKKKKRIAKAFMGQSILHEHGSCDPRAKSVIFAFSPISLS
ncbi:MAG: hypothetical protein LBD68_03725 [Zoogloeaceae bacterium]|jgi:hypothetical protein|nr:hypothetical protein [Zoogloeaceae bacterium]